MDNFIWSSIGFYCLFGIFLFYQRLHLKNFRGASQAFGLALAASTVLATITGIAYLGYYGWFISWWAAIVILAIGILAGIAGLAIERLTGPFVLSLSGFVGWPACAYFMFKTLAK